MTFKLKIDCDNTAFADDPNHAELARILRELANALEERDGWINKVVHDHNGNQVGTAIFTK